MTKHSIKSILLLIFVPILHLSLSTPSVHATTTSNYAEMGLALATIPFDMAGHNYVIGNKTKRAAGCYIVRDILSILNKVYYFENFGALERSNRQNFEINGNSVVAYRDCFANAAFLMHDLVKLYKDIKLFRNAAASTPAIGEKILISGPEYALRVGALPLLKGLTAFAIGLSQDQSRSHACSEERYTAAAAHALTRLLDEYTELEADSSYKKPLVALILINVAWLVYEINGYIGKQNSFGECTLCTHDKYLIKLECEHAYCRGCLVHRVRQVAQNNNVAMTRCPHAGCNHRLTETDTQNITNNQTPISQGFARFVNSLGNCTLCTHEGVLQNLQCGHRFCTGCLSQQINNAIQNQDIAMTRCPHAGCGRRLNYQDVLNATNRNYGVAGNFNQLINTIGYCGACHNDGLIQPLNCGHMLCAGQECQTQRITLGCGHSACRTCLVERFNNALDFLMPEFLNCNQGNCRGRLNMANVAAITNNNQENMNRFNALIHPVQECTLCMDDAPHATLECGHRFCTDCLDGQVQRAVGQNAPRAAFTCPSRNCNHRLTVPEVIDITNNNQDVVNRFGQALVRFAPGTRECPTPNCNGFYPNPRYVAQDHHCGDCQQHYCARCQVQHPANVADCFEALHVANPELENGLRENRERNQQGVQQVEQRRCPRCIITIINRTQGCNHMNCGDQNTPGCGYQFCYVCGGAYINQGGRCSSFLCANPNGIRN